jgi:hypothetical protein
MTTGDRRVQMMFFKRLFGHREKPAAEPTHGLTPQTQAEQQATRQHMEAELAADRERRGATDIRPGGEPPAEQDAGQGTTDDA